MVKVLNSLRRVRLYSSAFAVLLVLLFDPLPGWSQGALVTGSISGAVTDSSGALIPAVNVTATEVRSGVATKTTTDKTGYYTFPALAPGEYALSFGKAGFKTTVLSGVGLLVDGKIRVDAQMPVGSTATTVEVRSVPATIDTTTASIGTVLESKVIVDLPLNLRTYSSLAVLVPGTTPDNGGIGTDPKGSPFGNGATYAANGARDSSNIGLVDGVDTRGLTDASFILEPPPDAIQEFAIQTNIYNAAYGEGSGSTINLVTKSGTNQIHGSIYEFLRNDKFDARNFFTRNQVNPSTGQEIPGSARSELRRNQFGFSIGGPIRKDKTFWFANYEGLRDIAGLSEGLTIPTTQEKAGDLSGTLTGNKINLCGAGGPPNLNFDTGQLFNPATESLFVCPSGSANAGSNILVGSPIPGNIITNIDPVAQKILALYPNPNRSGYPNYLDQLPHIEGQNTLDVRIDQNFSEKDRLFGRYLFGQDHTLDPNISGTPFPGFGGGLRYRAQDFVLGWDHTFGANLISQARFGFQRVSSYTDCETCPRPAGTLAGFGIKNLSAIGPTGEGVPLFYPFGFSLIGDGPYRPGTVPSMIETYRDNVTWVHHHHTVEFGASVEPWQMLRKEGPAALRGEIFYSGQYSALANEIPAAGLLSGLADLMTGYPYFGERSVSYRDLNLVGGKFVNLYAQDDYRVTPRLTLNLGLRWEYREPPVDKRGNLVTLVPTGPKFSGPGNALLVTAAPAAQNDALCTQFSFLLSSDGRCLVATSAQRSQLGFTGRTAQSLIFPDHRDFAPRIGLAWRPTKSDRLVVRGGYGIFYDVPPYSVFTFVDNNPVFSPTELYTTAFGSPPPLTPGGFPTNTENVFAGANRYNSLNSEFSALYVDPHMPTPLVHQWSFGVESQLAENLGLDLNYVGAKGTNLGVLHYFGNQPEPGVGPRQARRPYPDFNIMLFESSGATSDYNALEAKLTKRFSGGLFFLASYTFGKSLDDGEGDAGSFGHGNGLYRDDNNIQLDRGRSLFDARQRFVFSYDWELPVGSGKRYLNQRGVAEAILGGWHSSGIVSFQSGFPFVVAAPDFSNTGSTSSRPDRICNGTGQKTVNNWFNASCFTVTALQSALTSGHPRFGNSGRNILDGPGIRTWDFGLYKDFRLSERFALEFRSEFYNFTNNVNFGEPDTFITDPNVAKISNAGSPRDIQFALKLLF